jgi:hypothetical protein
MNHAISANTVAKLLTTLGYSRQVNRKTNEGSKHPDRDGQFQHINSQVTALQAAGQPVISVDTKKKELIGEYKNGGSDYRPAGCPDEVNVHDFVDKELGKVAPYITNAQYPRSLRRFIAKLLTSLRHPSQRFVPLSKP